MKINILMAYKSYKTTQIYTKTVRKFYTKD